LQETRLFVGGVSLKADVSLLHHLGSNTSSIGDFLDAAQAHWVLVHSSDRSRFGHTIRQSWTVTQSAL
jgi:beta-lactamase superfamily II metal-dependent hydrolase